MTDTTRGSIETLIKYDVKDGFPAQKVKELTEYLNDKANPYAVMCWNDQKHRPAGVATVGLLNSDIFEMVFLIQPEHRGMTSQREMIRILNSFITDSSEVSIVASNDGRSFTIADEDERKFYLISEYQSITEAEDVALRMMQPWLFQYYKVDNAPFAVFNCMIISMDDPDNGIAATGPHDA